MTVLQKMFGFYVSITTQKGIMKLVRYDFQAPINAADEDHKLRKTIRFFSELRMSQLKDADIFSLPNSFGTESDIYTKGEDGRIVEFIIVTGLVGLRTIYPQGLARELD